MPRSWTEKLAGGLLLLALLAVGGLAWWLRLAPPLVPQTAPLAALPERIGSWQSREIPLQSVVESELEADFNLQRTLWDATGQVVWIYVGYYGTTRGGRPEHTPRGCYTGAGWGIEDSRTQLVDPARDLQVNEYRVSRDGEERLVHFYYRSFQRTGMLGGIDQNLDRIRGRLLHGRADGALVRVSTPMPEGDDVAARSRLFSVTSELDQLLAEHWPGESVAAGSGS